MSELPVCKYDPNCYQKNPLHFKKFSHPISDANKNKKNVAPQPQQQQPGAPQIVLDEDDTTMVMTVYANNNNNDNTTAASSITTSSHNNNSSSSAKPQQQQLPSPRKSSASASPLGSPSKRMQNANSFSSFHRPEPRSSPLKSSNDPDEVFEMPFPKKDMKMILDIAQNFLSLLSTTINVSSDNSNNTSTAVAAFSKKSPLQAFPGIFLVGPFEVMLKGANYESDRRKWMHHRQPLHPPEAQTIAYVEPSLFQKAFGISVKQPRRTAGGGERRGRDGDNSNVENSNNNKDDDDDDVDYMSWPTLCYFRDDPSDQPFVVASHGICGRDIKPLLQSFPKVLCHILRSYISKEQAPSNLYQFNPSTTMLLARKLISVTLDGNINDLGKIDKEISSFARERTRKVVAKTSSGIGIVVPYDKQSDIGYRPPHLSTFQLSQKLININTGKNIAKDQSELDEQLRWADIANDECDFGMGLEIGLNFLYHSKVNEDESEVRNGYVFSNAVRMLDVCYDLLMRGTFKHILNCHAYTFKGGRAK